MPRDERLDEHDPRRSRLAEHEVEGERAEGVEDGHDGDRQERRVGRSRPVVSP